MEENTRKDDFLLDSKIIYLNHGSFGATPRPVFTAYQKWQLELERQPVEFLGRRASDLLAISRSALANYFHTDRDNLVYITNATTGLNIIARSLRLGPGDEILTSDHEYGALDRTWQFLSQKQGFTYINHPVRLPLTDSSSFIENFWDAVTNRTRVIFLSHITSPTALIFPVDEICRRARQHGIITVIDGAHVPGQIDLDLDDLGADFYSGNLHKWLCAPKGSAFLYAAPKVQPLIEPLVVSWGWQPENSGPSPFVDYLEWAGTRDISPFLAVPDAIQYQQEHHWASIRSRCHELLSQTINRIQNMTGLPDLAQTDSWYGQMAAAFLPEEIDINHLKTILYEKYSIEVPLIRWNGHNLIRVSVQSYNTPEDLDCLINAFAEELHLKAA